MAGIWHLGSLARGAFALALLRLVRWALWLMHLALRQEGTVAAAIRFSGRGATWQRGGHSVQRPTPHNQASSLIAARPEVALLVKARLIHVV